MIKLSVPCIIIPGFCQSKLVIPSENGNAPKKVWPVGFDMKKAAKKVFPAYLKTVLCRSDKGFTDSVSSIFFDILHPMSNTPDGEKRYNVKALQSTASVGKSSPGACRFAHKIAPVDMLSEVISDDSIYVFSYDFFSQPEKTAEELDSFIEFVKKDSGSDKVDLLPYSLGGPVTLSYFERFTQKDDIRKVLFLVPALNGSSLIADIMEKNVDKKQGYSVLEFIFSKKVSDAFRKVLFLTKWDVRYSLLYKSLDTTIDTVLKNSLLMWSLVPLERYQALSGKLLSGEEHKTLLSGADRYNETRKNAAEILRRAEENGTGIYICAGFGRRLMEISTDGETSSDSVITVDSASLGAKAKIGDNAPDTQCAAFPETTWFVKNLSHVDVTGNINVQRLVKAVFTDEGFTDIHSDASLPQVM